MLISSKGRYALRLMIYIAALGDAEGKIALREVADREHISQKYLEQLVRPLMKADLLKSVRGKGGGYKLTRKPEEYTPRCVPATSCVPLRAARLRWRAMASTIAAPAAICAPPLGSGAGWTT